MDYNLILHLDSKDPDMFRLVARNAKNYLDGLPNEKFELVIVANGGGATQFVAEESAGFLHALSPDIETRATLQNLANELLQRGVKIKICANALREHEIEHDRIWSGCEIVPSGLVEIVRLQRSGYAYIKP